MLRQICYLSTAREELGDAALCELLFAAERHNEAARVSGLLAYGGGIFFQVLEGPRDSVGATLHRIRRDPRHHGLMVLQDEAIAARDFEDWRMAFRPLDQATARSLGGAAHIDASAIPAIVAGLSNPLSAAFLRRFAVAA